MQKVRFYSYEFVILHAFNACYKNSPGTNSVKCKIELNYPKFIKHIQNLQINLSGNMKKHGKYQKPKNYKETDHKTKKYMKSTQKTRNRLYPNIAVSYGVKIVYPNWSGPRRPDPKLNQNFPNT